MNAFLVLVPAALLPMIAAPALAQDAAAEPAGDPPAMAMPDGGAADPEMMAEMPILPQGATDMESPGVEMAMEIVVTGHRLRPRFITPSSGAVLGGEDLVQQARATIGDTLAKLPGVSSTSFGPGASRPVLRGLQGERTRLLIDGIQSLDVSNTSPDHAVAINPLLADRIEILRGPSALLYASGAVGGVVNTAGGRIPRNAPADGFSALLASGYSSASDEFTGGGKANFAAGPLVFHLDGHYLNASTLDIGGFVLAEPVREAALASPDPAIQALAALRGRLPNSSAETWDVGGGATFIVGPAHFGVSVAYATSFYGLPTRFSLDPGAVVPNTLIDLNQTRVDLRGEVPVDNPWIERIRLRFGWADYAHDEVLDTGELVSTFLNQAFEARAEVVGVERGIWRATTGIQLYFRDFSVRSDAPLLPATDTTQIATFSHHEFDLAPLKLELGWRYETTDIESQPDPILGNPDIDRDFTSVSGTIAASYALARNWNLSANGFYSERAPVVEELFTQGVDPGTQGVLLGNPALGEETSWGVEAVVRGFGARWSIEASAYYTRFPDYIFASQTSDVVDGLPVFQFVADRDEYYGFEIQGKADVATLGAWTIGVDALADYIRATLLGGGGPVPRIPPLRILGGMTARSETLDGRIELEWTSEQDRVSEFETPTADFFILSASANWKPLGSDHGLTLGVQANNILDATARRHASFLKDFAPIAGADIRVNARWSF